MTAGDILPLCEEAVKALHLSEAPRDLAEFVAAHESRPPPAEHIFCSAYHRVSSSWFQRWDRIEHCDALSKGLPWVDVVIDTRHGCQEADHAFQGKAWSKSAQVPVLPLHQCSAKWCRCFYRGRTASKRQKEEGM